ncbi:MAG TPA: CHASE domain-containing protein, partial [Usitatibacter sp.]|nr:CHASE domain-containing protein [Usitatibacter sp.]
MTTNLRPQSVALIALAAGVAATLLAWYVTGRSLRLESSAEFANRSQLAASVLERRIQRYVDLLYNLDAFANHEEHFTRREFHDFVAGLDLGSRLPGVQAVEFIRRVEGRRLQPFAAMVRGDRSILPQGYPTFAVKPPGERDEYWVIDYLEPIEGNENAFGLDIRSRPGALQAAERSRDSGLPTMTGRYRLAQEKGASYGLVMYLPVYGAQQPRTIEERRELLVGFVNVVLRVDDVLAPMMTDPVSAGLHIRVHDRGEAGLPPQPASDTTAFYGSQAPGEEPSLLEWRPRQHQDVAVAGRQWQLEFTGDAAWSPLLAPAALMVLCSGLLVSFMLYGILSAIARTRS